MLMPVLAGVNGIQSIRRAAFYRMTNTRFGRVQVRSLSAYGISGVGVRLANAKTRKMHWGLARQKQIPQSFRKWLTGWK